MTYLQAFLLGGALCLLTQLLFRTTKRAIVTVLTLAYCIGILMTAMGWMAPLSDFGQCGMYLLLIGGGEAAYWGMVSLLQGNPSDILRYLALVVFCFAIGIGGGFLLHGKRMTPACFRALHTRAMLEREQLTASAISRWLSGTRLLSSSPQLMRRKSIVRTKTLFTLWLCASWQSWRTILQ